MEILVLKDRDISSGRLNTEKDRQIYLNNNPKNHRVLKRWEIENYLFDMEILKKYCSINSLTFKEEEYNNFITDLNNQNIKDETPRVKNFCSINTNVNSEKFKLNLSTLITEDTSTFIELERCIFERL